MMRAPSLSRLLLIGWLRQLTNPSSFGTFYNIADRRYVPPGVSIIPHCLLHYFNSLFVYMLQHVLDHSAQMYQAAVVTSGPPQSTIPLVMFGDKSHRSGSCCFVSQASCQIHKISLKNGCLNTCIILYV